MNYKIALIKGDGIGPEIVDEAVKVLDRVGVKYGHTWAENPLMPAVCH
jgi:3-isopropylmalate dehydrogenase